jgi:hypothetical protein
MQYTLGLSETIKQIAWVEIGLVACPHSSVPFSCPLVGLSGTHWLSMARCLVRLIQGFQLL